MWLFTVVACWILQTADTEKFIGKRHLNPQGFMNITEIIDYWGYPSEEYQVLTEDGYYLQTNRIPYGVHSPEKTGPRPAVLLVHGFLAEGRSWIANLPNNSLAFFLADAGYDVWILNCRGTTWSRRHLYLSIDQEQFWDFRLISMTGSVLVLWETPPSLAGRSGYKVFLRGRNTSTHQTTKVLMAPPQIRYVLDLFSFHELGMYDVPATIEFILQKTKQDSLYYAAHSQGSTAGLIAFSVMPQLAQKVKLFLSFSPPYTLVGIRGFFGQLVRVPEALKTVIWGKKELYVFSNRIKYNNVKMCSYPGLDQLCLKVMFTVTGVNKNNINVSRADVYAGIFPDFSSAKTESHGTQVFKSKQFKQFDYGPKNLEIYNATTPPFYKIEDMRVPTAVWYGGKDIVTTKKDIELLLPRIPHLVFRKYVPYWEHLECVWGLDAPELMYQDMLFLMQKYK